MSSTSHAQTLMSVAMSCVVMWCLSLDAPVEAADWLITPEEAALAPAPQAGRGILEAGRDDLSIGPVIDVVEPANGGRAPMPIQVLIHFSPRLVPIDLGSLKVTLVKFIPIDITDRIRPFVTAEGIDVKEAKIPPGKHRVRIALSDRSGEFSVKEITFEVL
jgi:hypothetical protein